MSTTPSTLIVDIQNISNQLIIIDVQQLENISTGGSITSTIFPQYGPIQLIPGSSITVESDRVNIGQLYFMSKNKVIDYKEREYCGSASGS